MNVQYLEQCGARIREERDRLQLNQVVFGRAGGVGRGSQVGYESGQRPPTAEYMAGIAAIGADVQFIVTGVRSENLPKITMPKEPTQRSSSGEIDAELLADIIKKVNEIARRSRLSDQTTPEDIAKIVATVYKQYKSRGLKPKQQDPAILTAFDLLAG